MMQGTPRGGGRGRLKGREFVDPIRDTEGGRWKREDGAWKRVGNGQRRRREIQGRWAPQFPIRSGAQA